MERSEKEEDRIARLQMTCPEKHRERDRSTENENRAPKRTFSAPTRGLKALKLLPMQTTGSWPLTLV